jgi:AP-4 complex subunit epsilon-1
VNLYIEVAQSGSRLSDIFIIAKVIGLYAQLSHEYDLDFIARLLCDLADAYEGRRDWLLNALLDISAQLDDIPPQVADVFEYYKQSKLIIVQEICYEALALLNARAVLATAVDGFDEQLSFLDALVADAVKRGQKTYIDITEREGDLMLGPKRPKVKINCRIGQPKEKIYGVGGIMSQEAPDEDLTGTGLRTAVSRLSRHRLGFSRSPGQSRHFRRRSISRRRSRRWCRCSTSSRWTSSWRRQRTLGAIR